MKHGLIARLTVGYAVLLSVVVAGFVVTVVSIMELQHARRAEEHSTQVLVTSNALEKSVLDLETGLRGFLLTAEPRFLAPYRNATTQYPVLATQLERLTAGAPAQQDRAATIAAEIRGYVTDWAEPQIRRARFDLAGAQQAVASGRGKVRVDEIRRRFAALDDDERQILEARGDHADWLGTLSFVVAFVALGVSALLVVVFALAARSLVAVPLTRLLRGVGRVGAGDLGTRVPAGGTAEVGALIAGFNAMAEGLEHQHDELENQKAELEAQQVELEVALQAVEEEKSHAELLRTLGDDLAGALRLDRVSETALQRIGDVAGAEVGALYVVGERADLYALAARRGLAAPAVASALAAGDGLAGRALAERRAVAVSYGAAEMELPGLVHGRDVLHELHLPLLHGERTVGVVSLGRARDVAFSRDEVWLLDVLAQRIAVAIAEALSLDRAESLALEFQVLLASIDEGIYGVDVDGRITRINRAALERTGYVEEELIGRDAHTMLQHTRADGSPYPREESPLLATVATGERRRVDGDCYWRKDGTSFPVELTAYPLHGDGAVVGAVVTFLDIAVRRRLERQRDTQHAVTHVLAASQSVPDALPRLLEAVCAGLGWQVGLAWQPSSDGTELRCVAVHAVPGWELEAKRRSARAVASGTGAAGAALASREPAVHARGDGAAVAVPVAGLNDELFGVAEFFSERPLERDGLLETLVSIAGQTAQFVERKRTELEIERQRQEFVATVSHELRTPLTAIDGWLHEVLTEEPGPLNDDQRRFLQTVKRNSERLTRMVGDLLVARQIETGRLELDIREIDLADVLRESVETVAAAAAAKQVELDAALDDAAPARGDRNRLAQLFGNVLSNAVKFTPAGGRVAVSVTTDDGLWRVAVSDTGIGVPSAERPRLFERFYRASSATERGIAGTGLGLSISKAIAEGHGGSIELEEREGPGTTFVVELPRE